MNNLTGPATPPRSQAAPLPGSGRPAFGQASAGTLGMKWSALHDAATVVATLAGFVPDGMTEEQRNFPVTMRDAGGWRLATAQQGIDDLAAVLEPGLAALLAAHARGAATADPALSLWEEFLAAQSALLALAPPSPANPAMRMT